MTRTLPKVTLSLALLALGASSHVSAQGSAVADVQVAPPSVNLNVSLRSSVFATAYDSRGNVIATSRIAWSTSNAAVVRIEVDSTSPEVANLIGVGPGAAVIEARVGNRRGVATVQVSGAGSGGTVAVTTTQGTGTTTVTTAPATNAALLKLDPSSLFLLPGESSKLTPLFLKDDGTQATTVKLIWKTLVPTVANVDGDGGVVGISPGQGLIEASVGALAARVPIQVTLSKIAVTRRTATMSPGTSDTLTVFVPEQNNRPLAATSIQWRSSDETVVKVSPFGIVSAVGGGRAEIIAAGFLQEIRVPVNVHRQVEFLKFSPPAKDTVRVALGAPQKFLAEPQAIDGTPVPEASMTWRMLDTSVASFDATTGTLTPKRVGTTKLRIGVVGGGLDTAWTVSVIAGGLKLNTRLAGLTTGQRIRLGASLTDDAGRSLAPASGVRWSSSAPNIAQVDGDGNVTAAGFGRAVIIGATPWGKADSAAVLVQGELLVTSTRGGTPDLYALDRKAPGTLFRLTSFPSNEVGGTYAPGGATILFVSSKDGNQELYAMDADGANVRRLTNTPAQEDSPEWMPDGSKIIYASNATGTYQIWSMNPDGTEQKRLTEGASFNFQPAVSPDGKTVAFTSARDGNYDIYLMNPDGTDQRTVLKSPSKETIPQWFPDGQLAFLQEQHSGTSRNSPLVSVVVRRDPAGSLVNLTPLTMMVTDFSISAQGDLLALIVSSGGQGGKSSSALYLGPAAPGSTPTLVPLLPGEQVFSPSFRR